MLVFSLPRPTTSKTHQTYLRMKVTVIGDEIADENPANQSTDGKQNHHWNKVTSDLIGKLLYWSLNITQQRYHLLEPEHHITTLSFIGAWTSHNNVIIDLQQLTTLEKTFTLTEYIPPPGRHLQLFHTVIEISVKYIKKRKHIERLSFLVIYFSIFASTLRRKNVFHTLATHSLSTSLKDS